MDREAIKKIIPHREPMLLLDEVVQDEEGNAVGRYTVRGDEFFLQGHFPGNPVVPGVILCEIMAQVCCAFLVEKAVGKTPYYTGINNVRFKRPVKPGDTMEMHCQLTKSKPPFYFASGRGTVDGQLAISGEFSFALVDQDAK